MNLDLKPNFLLLNTLDIENLRKLDRIHPYPAKFTILNILINIQIKIV